MLRFSRYALRKERTITASTMLTGRTAAISIAKAVKIVTGQPMLHATKAPGINKTADTKKETTIARIKMKTVLYSAFLCASLCAIMSISLERTVLRKLRTEYHVRHRLVKEAAVRDSAKTMAFTFRPVLNKPPGWVADTATVDPRSYIGDGCMVFGHSVLGPDVRLHGSGSYIGGRNRIMGNVALYGENSITGENVIDGTLTMRDKASIDGEITIDHDARVYLSGRSAAMDQVKFHRGFFRIDGAVCIVSASELFNDLHLMDNIKVNAILHCQPRGVKGLIPVDFVYDDATMYFSLDGLMTTFDRNTETFSDELGTLLSAIDLDTVRSFSKTDALANGKAKACFV